MPRTDLLSDDNDFTSNEVSNILAIIAALQLAPLTYVKELKLKAITAQQYSKAAVLRDIELKLLNK